jgi:hypothetical protein
MWGAVSDERTGILLFLLVLDSAVILGSESCGTLLLSQIRDFPNLEGQVPVFISLRNRVTRLYPQALGSLFVVSFEGYGRGIRTRIHAGIALNSVCAPPCQLSYSLGQSQMPALRELPHQICM